ncbi:hypothetical protein ADK43_17270 [Streptomyces rimosus subsp. rimosus]|nr:hypothetical protein ADK43_17270 [Streptomyces rimosus subsp. rimosus]
MGVALEDGKVVLPVWFDAGEGAMGRLLVPPAEPRGGGGLRPSDVHRVQLTSGQVEAIAAEVPGPVFFLQLSPFHEELFCPDPDRGVST